MRIGCCITKAHNIHSEYLLVYHYNNGHAIASQCYVIRTLHMLLITLFEYGVNNTRFVVTSASFW